MLRRKGIRVVSITEHADDSPTGKLMEAIIESVDEFYSENLAQEVVRGMREAASRGFFLGSISPFGYRRVKVSDGAKERPTLEVDPVTAPVVKEIFESSLSGNGLKEICKTLNGRGITNRGNRWNKGGLHYLLTNEAYTGTAVWGRTSKGEKAQDPVRVEGAWPALVSRELFVAVQQAMRDRAPKVQRPARVGSKFLLSGLLKCGVCGRPYRAQGAKSGQFAYYVCGTLFREGAGTCSARYLNAPRVEDFIVEKIRERILTEETIVELVTLVAEEIDAMAGELSGRLEVIEAELGDVRKRLEKLYEAIETSELTLEVLSPRILSLRHREEQLEAARDDAERQLEQRRVELPTTEEIKEYVAEFREFLEEGTIPECKALIRNFVEGIEVTGDEAVLTYTVPMPKDGVKRESASVLDFVKSGPPPTAFVEIRDSAPCRGLLVQLRQERKVAKEVQVIRHLAGIAEIVEDMDAAVGFYRDVLGLTVHHDQGSGYAEVEIGGVLHFGIWLRSGAAETTFGDAGEAHRIPLGFTVGFEVDSTEAASEAVGARGWPIEQAPKRESWGQTTSRFFSASGMLCEFSETPNARRIVQAMRVEAEP